MDIQEKKRLFKYLAKHYDSMDYPPIMLYRNIKRERIKIGWRKRVKEILKGAIDYPGMYVHIPYCRTKCFFCKFRTRVANSEEILDKYLKCLNREIDEFSPIFKKLSFKTLYLGGGTPTILSASQLDSLFNILEKRFNLKETVQRLIESTPVTLSLDRLGILRKHGFNRLTIGVQTVDKKIIKLINRSNQTEDMVREAFFKARSSGMEFINLDLMLGLPGQTIHSFLKDLRFILSLKPEAIHINPLEEDEQVILLRKEKKIKEGDRNKMNEMLESADIEIKKYGYQYYRNEPYVLSPQAANLQDQLRFFSNGSLLGLGAGALAYIPNHYTYHNNVLEDYLNYRAKGNFPPYIQGYPLTKRESILNYVVHNIRSGINRKMFSSIFGVRLDKEFRIEFESLRKLRRLQEDKDSIKLVANNNLEFRTYSKFFFSPKVVKELRQKVCDK